MGHKCHGATCALPDFYAATYSSSDFSNFKTITHAVSLEGAYHPPSHLFLCRQPGSSSISPQSTANKIAVQLEHYLRSFESDLLPSSSVAAEETSNAVASLCQWTVSNVEVWQSHPSRASSSCADHIYLILEATHELEGLLRLQINSTHCSGHFDTDEIDKALLGLQLARNPEPRLLESFHPSQCPPSSPMSYTSLITVTPIAQGARTVDECIRRVSFDLDVDSVYQADSSECTNGEQEITLLSIALLITTSLKVIDLEKTKGSLCQNIVRGITEGAMKTGQPFVENSSGSSDGSARCEHSISSQTSYERVGPVTMASVIP